MVKEKLNPAKDSQGILELPKELILYNDEVNTFDFVIRSLIEVCEHDYIQAEQCTWIAHYKGKCGVKTGSKEELIPIKKELINRKLTVEIK